MEYEIKNQIPKDKIEELQLRRSITQLLIGEKTTQLQKLMDHISVEANFKEIFPGSDGKFSKNICLMGHSLGGTTVI